MQTQTSDVRRWVLMAVVVLAVVALIAFARGAAHHHGRQVDTGMSLGAAASVSTPDHRHA